VLLVLFSIVYTRVLVQYTLFCIYVIHEEIGGVTTVLRVMGMMNLPAWFSSVWLARFAITIVDVWQWTLFCFLVILAGLQSHPDEIHETLVLETSSGWQIFRLFTLPLIGPVLFTVAVLGKCACIR
jgi:multiple sugar transport system permease protein